MALYENLIAGLLTLKHGLKNAVTGKIVTPSQLDKIADLPETSGLVFSEVRAINEDGADTYTRTVDIPAGTMVHEIQFSNHTNWTAATSATLNLGYPGALTAFIDGLNVKTTDPADNGPYAVHYYFPAATQIVLSVTSVGAGDAGVEGMTVLYSQPNMS